MSKITYIASDCAVLDSNVKTGGGTDDTEALQKLLDKALEHPLHLVMDGAALVGGLVFHSNTTIECLNQSCGFYLKDNSTVPLLQNSNQDFYEIKTENVNLYGGTYNFNCLHQEHHGKPTDHEFDENSIEDFMNYWTFGFRIYGIRNLVIRDVTTVDQRTFTMMVANFENVTMDNIDIQLPNILFGQNQDGLHFWGPGRFLTLTNIKGTSGDDIIALAPDEGDCKSDITDVLINGLMLKEADQAIRLLSRYKGRLDRVVIRNVSGEFKSFGFYINPWFHDDKIEGNIGNITFENIDLTQKNHKYTYSSPLLFRLGGKIERMTLKNIRFSSPDDNAVFMQLGGPYSSEDRADTRYTSSIGTVLIDGLEILKNKNGNQTRGIEVKCPVENLIVRDAFLNNFDDNAFLTVFEKGEIEHLSIDGVLIADKDNLVSDAVGKIENINIRYI
ncbi:MAG: hypothetical protein WCN92_05470 [Eubacteriales bacterium]